MADFNFKGVTAIRLPEGFVKEIKDGDGNLLWKTNENKWVLKEETTESLIETIAYASRITCYSTITVSDTGFIALTNPGFVSAINANASYPYYKSSSGVICRRTRGVSSGSLANRKLAIYGYIITAVEE